MFALGQEAPLEVKQVWDPDFEKRKTIKAILDPMIPEFSVGMGGASSIDVTRPAVDKACDPEQTGPVIEAVIACVGG